MSTNTANGPVLLVCVGFFLKIAALEVIQVHSVKWNITLTETKTI